MPPHTPAPGKMIAFTNVGGEDCSRGLMNLLRSLPKGKKICVIELPDHGLPRICYQLGAGQEEDWPEQRSIQQWMLDYEQGAHQDIDHYLIEHSDYHYLCLHPNVSAINPVIPFAMSQQALIEIPLHLKLRLTSKYDYVIMVTQGTFIHPLTHFTIRYADGVIMYSRSQSHIEWHQRAIETLTLQYQVDPARLTHMVQRKKGITIPSDSYIRVEDIVMKINQLSILPIFWRSESSDWIDPVYRSGSIRPDDYQSYKYRADLEPNSSQVQDSSIHNDVVQQMSFDWTCSHEDIAKVQFIDKMHDSIKQYICENGCQSSIHLRNQFKIRRQRVLNILKELANEGMLNRPTPEANIYTLKWTRSQIDIYLNNPVHKMK